MGISSRPLLSLIGLKNSSRENLILRYISSAHKRGIEYRLNDKLNYSLHLINMRGIARSLTLKNLLVPFIIIGALIRSFSLLNKIQPAMVIGTGGYVCWPILKAAGWKKIRTRLQEQNSFPGVTIRQLAPNAEKIYLGFESAQNYMHTKGEIIVSGNPVRNDIAER